MRRASFATTTLVAAAFAVAMPRPASAQQVPPAIRGSLAIDGSIAAGALIAAGLASMIPVDTSARWNQQLLPFDTAVEKNFSASAAKSSDVLATLVVAMPLAVQVGGGFNREMGQRSLVYTETIALGLALNGLTKYLVGRPRPYVYNPDPRVQAYAKAEGEGRYRDSHLSFFSGHATTSFAAAVAGGYLFAQTTTDTRARATVWASGLALAGATSNLRVRAGKHFYSDVLVGAVIGTALGWGIPYLHYRDRGAHSLATSEWIAIATAPVAGVLVAQLLPAKADITEPLAASPLVAPWITPGGGGVMLARAF